MSFSHANPPLVPSLRYCDSIEPELAAFIDALPKAELHLHIDGALPWEQIRSTDPSLPERPDVWDRNFRFASFEAFLELCDYYCMPWLTSLDRCAASVEAMIRTCAAQNVRYVETSIDLGAALRIGSPADVLAAMRVGASRVEGVTVRLFMGISRDALPRIGPVVHEVLDAPDLNGIDLHGIEPMPIEPWVVEFWRKAQEMGKMTKAHAGEFGPAASVREVVEKLNVTRVEHGTRAIENPEVVALLRDRNVILDVCPISNLKLQVVPSLAEHPIAALHRSGVICTLNTDDPLDFGSTLREEYALLVTEMGLDRQDLITIATNGFRAALLSVEEKNQLIGEVKRIGTSMLPASEGPVALER
ncbi:adenosine deaminase family protein [Telmatospirillum sp.]|uniref:adenosine deaminase family protein n=1 Tax=Telmatospirillum sp. TaxID=2079197 RepID=UPI002842E45E|nr:adenosine deaminase family protein [Telmatospirillum sp.]MDR3437378.1 adenosine deaminase family protein [Telmatospirillum sp.]